MKSSIHWLMLLAAALLPLGCNNNNASVGSVSGTVSYDGQPLKSGEITFLPAQGRPGYGKVVDGQIQEVTTESAGDGAPVGTNRITITAREESTAVAQPGQMAAPGRSLIPERYGDAEKSGLTADIKAGTNELKLDLTKQ